MAGNWASQSLQKTQKAREEFVGVRRQLDAVVQGLEKLRADQVAPLGEELVRLNSGILQARRALKRACQETTTGHADVQAAADGALTRGQVAALEQRLARIVAALGSTQFQLGSLAPKLDRMPSMLRRVGEDIAAGLRQIEQIRNQGH